MRLRNADYLLLKNVWAYLVSSGRDDLSAALKELLDRFEQKQAETRAANRKRSLGNRRAGYRWESVPRPKHSKYYGEENDDGQGAADKG